MKYLKKSLQEIFSPALEKNLATNPAVFILDMKILWVGVKRIPVSKLTMKNLTQL